MLRLIVWSGVLIFGLGLADAADDLTYTAAVVEMSTAATDDTAALRVAARVKKIVDQINAEAHRNVDIIVFPEYAIPEASAQPIPSPSDQVVLCGNEVYSQNLFLPISCAARSARTYVVINALTQHNCSAEQLTNGDIRPCSSDNLNVYNTNIVFDRTGAIISTYRKFNIYDEAINSTLTSDNSTFDTDFGVTFGHLTSFDILFEQPTARLLKLGVKNFVYPTEWFSALPFLTAIQLQQNWAHANNVNLLAAGISNPQVGSTGSGIYSGVQGALHRHFSSTRFDLALVFNITKEPASNALTSLPMPVATPLVKLLRDQIDSYTYVKLNASDASATTTLCHSTDFCCNFRFWLEDVGATTNQGSYEYVAAVHNGTRTFGRNPKKEKVVSCSVFTCLDATNITTCGHISTSPVSNRYRFKDLLISGRFRHDRTMVMPNTLAIGLVPLPVNNFDFNSSDPITMGRHQYKTVNISLVRFDHHLLTFGIWGRDYGSSASQSTVAGLLLLVASLFSVLL